MSNYSFRQNAVFTKFMFISTQRPLLKHATSSTGVSDSALLYYTNQSAVSSTVVQPHTAVLDVIIETNMAARKWCVKVAVHLKDCHKNAGNMLGLTIREVSTSVHLLRVCLLQLDA